MIFAAIIRAVLVLRRIAKAMEESNILNAERLAIERDRMAMQYPAWYKAGNKVPHRGKVTIEHVKPEDWEDQFRRSNP